MSDVPVSGRHVLEQATTVLPHAEVTALEAVAATVRRSRRPAAC
jgi:hypothetical protein